MSKVRLKTPQELELMRAAGRLLAQVFRHLDTYIVPGVSTMEINRLAERYIIDELKARPASQGQYDYPYVLNASVNQVVCHGIPSDTHFLASGDIANIDITLEKNGFIADSSKTYLVGKVTPEAKRLVDTTYEAMWRGINAVKPGATLGDVGHAIQHHVERHGYSIVREYCGHGVGREMHEEPQVLHYGTQGNGLMLKEGMVFTIEPMVNMGKARIKTKTGWLDGRHSGQETLCPVGAYRCRHRNGR